MQKSKKKVKIDKQRFKQVFDQKSDFNTIGKFDKTGKKIDIKDKTMQKYYQKNEDSDNDDPAPDGKKFYDESGNFEWKPD